MPTINKRFLVKLLIALILFAGVLVGTHTIQAERIPAALKQQADRSAAAGKPDAAARYLRRYLEFQPDDIGVRSELADLLLAHGGSPVELYNLYEKVLRSDPGRTAQRRAAVDVCLKLRRFTDATEHATKYLDCDPKDVTVRLHLATAHAALGHVSETTAAFEAALKDAPADATVYRRYLAYLTAEANRPDEARSLVDRMAAALPDSPEPYLARARLELSKPDAVPGPAVLADATKALALAPQNAEALILKAECLQRARDVAGARDTLAAGLKDHPGDVRFVKRLAWLELNRGNPGRAVALLDDGLKAAKDGFEDLLVPLGDLLVQLGESARADELVRTLETRKTPLAPIQAKYLKARMLVHAAKWLEAVSLLTAVRTEGQNYPGLETQANLLLSVSYRQLGDTPHERECLQLILDRDPRHAAARVALGQSYLNAGLFADALREYEEAVRSPYASGGTLATVVRLRGLKLRGVGRPEEWAALDRAAASLTARVGPASSESAELRADLFRFQGRPDKAVAVLRQEAMRRPGNAALWARLIDETADLFGTAAGFQTWDEAMAMAGDGPDLRLARAMLAAKDPVHLRPIELTDRHIDTWAEADRTQYLYGLVEVYDRLGDAKNLARVYGLIARQRPTDPAAWFAAHRAGDADAAKRIRAIEGDTGPTVALVNGGRAAVTAAFGPAPFNVEACLALARHKLTDRENEAAAALFERAVRLDPTGVTPARDYLGFLAKTGAETKLAAFLARLNGDPRWVGDPVRRVVTTACLASNPEDAKRLLTAAEKVVGADPKAAAWFGDAYAARDMKPLARTHYEVAVASPYASVDDWIRYAGVDSTAPLPVQTAKAKLSSVNYWTLVAALGLAHRPETSAEFLTAVQTRLALELSRNDPERAIEVLDEAVRSPQFPPEQVGWAKRTLGMLLTDRGTAAQRKRAFELLVADPATAGTTSDEKRTTAAAVASLARFLDDPDRSAALRKSDALLTDVAAVTSSPRDRFLRYQVLRALGDPASRNEARTLLNGLIDPKTPNLDYLIAGLTEVGDGTSETERTLAESFAKQLRTSFPGDFRAVAAVTRHEGKMGCIDNALSLVDGYVRAETGPTDAQTRAARAADLLDGIARLPVIVVTPSPILPVGGVVDTGGSAGVNDPGYNPHRRLVDSAVAKYEGLILARPEAAAAAAALLAFDRRPVEAFALVEKYPALPTRLKAAAGVAILRAGPTTPAQTAKVKAWLDAAAAEEPDSLAVKLTAAEYRTHLQDYGGAETIYDAVLAADPTNVVALNNLAWLLAPNPGQSAKALALLDRAVSQTGLTAELLDTRARIRIAARQIDLAERDVREALRREPTPLRYFHLALALQAANPPRAEDAGTAYRTAKDRGLSPTMVHPADLGTVRALEAGK